MKIGAASAALLASVALSACDHQPAEVANNTAAQVQPVQATDVADQFTRAGLPITGVKQLTAATDPDHLLGQPGQYTSKATFSDTRHPHADRSTIEVFASPAQAINRAEVVTSEAKNPAAITRYQAVSGRMYLRLDEALPAAEADQYLSAFSDMPG